MRFIFLLLWGIFFIYPSILYSEQWIKPRDVIGDPMIARLQQGRKELIDLEKKEIKKYGYTGLEIMTYLDYNKDQGRDSEDFGRLVEIDNSGHIREYVWLERTKYYYKNHLDLLTLNGIKPGGVEKKNMGIYLEPPNVRRLGWITSHFLTSKERLNKREGYTWLQNLRKIRHSPSQAKRDNWFWGSAFTFDDVSDREPWEESHTILGMDELKGKKCFVIESKYQLDSNYYLGKRVTWVEAENFIDLHEEQFDRKGRLFRIFDKDWQQVKPWNYWALREWNAIDLVTGGRTLYQLNEWVFDQGYTDEDFKLTLLEKEEIWKNPKETFLPIKNLSNLSPPPDIRREFWDKIGVKPGIR